MDFYTIRTRIVKKDLIEIYPDFNVKKSKDLMTRGKAFYAIWDEKNGLWSTDEYDVQRLVDEDLQKFYEKTVETTDSHIDVKWMGSYSSNSWKKYKSFLKDMMDNYHQLDTDITFQDTQVKRNDYVSIKLPYSMKKGKCPAYEELMSTLYDPEERQKIEWIIGSIIAGDSKKIQKFLVFYGDPGKGKSTVLDIIESLFQGYCGTFDAASLTSRSNVFATEAFRSNPLIAIQHDGDLSKIEDNSKLNSIISHETIIVNEKFKSSYPMRLNCILLMATNKPVRITDAKAGIIRRLIDVRPTGNLVETNRYLELKDQIQYELGAIAYKCLQVYEKLGKNYYNKYRPVDMMYKTDIFFNFVEAYEDVFEEQDSTTLKQAYAMYKEFCDEGGYEHKTPIHTFREELKNYFETFSERTHVDGKHIRNYYKGFIFDKFNRDMEKTETFKPKGWIELKAQSSFFDSEMKYCPAQYANEKGVPFKKWANVSTNLSQINTSRLHYVKVPENHIVIDFDIKEGGEKSLEKNLEAANKFPRTYCETSKSGSGIHLHYIWDGDPNKLDCVYDDNIEIKVFKGNSSLRRMLTLCNDIPIATISSGLPLRKEKKVIGDNVIRSERQLRKLIEKNLRKEIHPATKPSIDFIFKILEDAYKDGMHYDVTNLFQDVYIFALNSTNHSDYCLDLVDKMHFKSDEVSEPINDEGKPIIFFDIEVFPNLFLVNWKFAGPEHAVVRMINPTASDIESLLCYRWIGFNNRRYDNHIMYAKMMGYSVEKLFELSQRLINGDKDAPFVEAYNLSYTDVYDFASAGNKKSLKKLEIEMGMHHKECEYDWNQPVPQNKWEYVAEYCDNDVLATEAAFNYLSGDWLSRQILADISGLTVNDTTNAHTTKIIFGNERKPQSSFNYRFMGDEDTIDEKKTEEIIKKSGLSNLDLEFTKFDKNGRPVFPGYRFAGGKSTYRGEEVGEGGYVYAEPGIYGDVGLDDVESMHPSSIDAEDLFGPYTENFRELKKARLSIKHEDWELVHSLMGGKLDKFVEKVKSGEITSKQLANALKTAINSVYGLTSASFSNPFRDPRNKDNIVAKRGALFMINLKHEVQNRYRKVAHIKTDSIKIPDVDNEIIEFIGKYGKMYGYNFDYEAIYDKMCLVNDAVYIARYATEDKCEKDWGLVPGDNAKHGGEWTATGTQFAVSYVFKKLFSGEEIQFEDLCVTKSVSTALYLDMNEKLVDPDDHSYVFIGKVGSFCPIKEGYGGGVLLRKADDKFSAAGGSKGYRWLEAEDVKKLNMEDCIDYGYFNDLTNDAKDAINKYGDFEWFRSDEPYSGEDQYNTTLPF